MEREAIEFHDSVLARVDRRERKIRLLFEPAYVHRSVGEPARDAGTGWSARVALTISQISAVKLSSELPCDISDGTLEIAERRFENIVPLPFDQTGKVSLSLTLSDGKTVTAVGEGAELRVVGNYEFVENVPAV